MAKNNIIEQPDILNLDTLGTFMDAQNDVVAPENVCESGKEDNTAGKENVASDTVVQEEAPVNVQGDSIPKKPKVARARRGRQEKVQPVIEDGIDAWGMMLRYAEYYNDNPDNDRITVVLNPDVKRALDIIRINCRQFNFGNILNAVCRTFIERNKEQIQRMQKNKGGIL